MVVKSRASVGVDGDGGEEGGQWKVMAADWIVMPRARSAGRKSVTVEPSSTSVACVRWFLAETGW